MLTDASENPTPIIIFVVEDDLQLQEVIGPALEDAGFTVLIASNGDKSVAMLEKDEARTIRALVTDIDLGTKVTGWHVAKLESFILIFPSCT